MQTIGVLGIQGSVIEHMQMISQLHAEGIVPLEVKTLEELHKVHGLIIPGGESTTMGKLLQDFHLMDPLRERITKGMPVWGTCAGLILLANKIVGEQISYLNVLDVAVRRNAYGSQLDSFTVEMEIPEIDAVKKRLVFIRAPWIEKVGASVQVLAKHADRIIAVRQGYVLGTTFHPELTHSPDFHKYFARICKQSEM